MGAQTHLEQHLNITHAHPPPSKIDEDKSTQLAKSQLGFIDLFAEPLWRIGAETILSGMSIGLHQIRENRQIWVQKVSPVSGSSTTAPGTLETKRESLDRGNTSGPRKFMSTTSLKERRPVRKERSFSSFIFWRRRDGKKSEDK
jgi:hypothetical protein